MREVIEQISKRINSEAPAEEARKLATASFLMTGIRIPQEEVYQLHREVIRMLDLRESTTYQFILDEGRIDEARKLLVRQGQKHVGPPSEGISTALSAIKDFERLEHLHDRMDKVKSWEELLQDE